MTGREWVWTGMGSVEDGAYTRGRWSKQFGLWTPSRNYGRKGGHEYRLGNR